MNRKEFLKSLGFTGGAIMATYCFGALEGCTHDPIVPIDFTLDLTEPANQPLNSVGGYIRINNIVIAQVAQDDFAAVTQKCSHEGQKQIIYRSSVKEFYCTAHGARFSTSGTGKNSLGKKNIAIYQTQLDGTTLRIFS